MLACLLAGGPSARPPPACPAAAAGVLVGGRSAAETPTPMPKFARMVLGTNGSIDFRAVRIPMGS